MPQIYLSPAPLPLPVPAVSAADERPTDRRRTTADRPIKQRAIGSTYANVRFTRGSLVASVKFLCSYCASESLADVSFRGRRVNVYQ